MEEIFDGMAHGGDAIGRNFKETQKIDIYSPSTVELSSGKTVPKATNFLKNGKNVNMGFNLTADPKGGIGTYKNWVKIKDCADLIPADSDMYLFANTPDGDNVPLFFSISGSDLIINTLGIAVAPGSHILGSASYLIN